jgi:hypothetical protein
MTLEQSGDRCPRGVTFCCSREKTAGMPEQQNAQPFRKKKKKNNNLEHVLFKRLLSSICLCPEKLFFSFFCLQISNLFFNLFCGAVS